MPTQRSGRMTAKPSDPYYLTNAAALRGYWVARYWMDSACLYFGCHDATGGASCGFASPYGLHNLGDMLRPSATVQSLEENVAVKDSAHDISDTKRLLFSYGLLIVGWLAVLIPFGVASVELGTVEAFEENSFLSSRHAAQIALPGLCYVVSVIIIAQEWTLPREAHLPPACGYRGPQYTVKRYGASSFCLRSRPLWTCDWSSNRHSRITMRMRTICKAMDYRALSLQWRSFPPQLAQCFVSDVHSDVCSLPRQSVQSRCDPVCCR